MLDSKQRLKGLKEKDMQTILQFKSPFTRRTASSLYKIFVVTIFAIGLLLFISFAKTLLSSYAITDDGLWKKYKGKYSVEFYYPSSLVLFENEYVTKLIPSSDSKKQYVEGPPHYISIQELDKKPSYSLLNQEKYTVIVSGEPVEVKSGGFPARKSDDPSFIRYASINNGTSYLELKAAGIIEKDLFDSILMSVKF